MIRTVDTGLKLAWNAIGNPENGNYELFNQRCKDHLRRNVCRLYRWN